jgi:hypothetical protein
MYNPLLDAPISEYKEAPIKTDFRQGLKFYRIAMSKKLTDKEKTWLMVRAFFKDIPRNDPDLFDFIRWYVAGGEEEKEAGKDKKRVFDFDIDSAYLFGAFMQVYKINLKETKMHWWDFLALFRALPEGTRLHSIIEIRGKKSTAGKDKEFDRSLREAQKAYALDDVVNVDLYGAW